MRLMQTCILLALFLMLSSAHISLKAEEAEQKNDYEINLEARLQKYDMSKYELGRILDYSTALVGTDSMVFTVRISLRNEVFLLDIGQSPYETGCGLTVYDAYVLVTKGAFKSSGLTKLSSIPEIIVLEKEQDSICNTTALSTD